MPRSSHTRRVEVVNHARHGEQPTGNRAAALQGVPVVYYVRHLGHVKIGHTTSLFDRLRSLRAKPADLLAWEPGDLTLERERHAQFRDARAHGENLGREHYRLSPELRTHMADLRAVIRSREVIHSTSMRAV